VPGFVLGLNLGGKVGDLKIPFRETGPQRTFHGLPQCPGGDNPFQFTAGVEYFAFMYRYAIQITISQQGVYFCFHPTTPTNEVKFV
jgi:hypothetical protein